MGVFDLFLLPGSGPGPRSPKLGGRPARHRPPAAWEPDAAAIARSAPGPRTCPCGAAFVPAPGSTSLLCPECREPGADQDF